MNIHFLLRYNTIINIIGIKDKIIDSDLLISKELAISKAIIRVIPTGIKP